jgi:hypothetical protein
MDEQRPSSDNPDDTQTAEISQIKVVLIDIHCGSNKLRLA